SALSEKIMRFEPERRVNTRAAAAHGVFQLYESQCEYTKAVFLQNPGIITPVFVRFSTLANVRGSGDCSRTPRGFAVRFFTGEGNFDLIGSNMPVMYSQHGATFADLIHAVKPEADNQVPHVSSAHNRFWDVISLNPEAMHKVMWTMSDRALPRSFAMMEGFGVHTFRFVNARGKSYWVKFHWKPLLGVHSLVWDEAVKLAAKDADFHLRHLWELIDQGHFPEWELGLQIVLEEDRYKFDFDLQDATKLIPESLVPVRIVGKLTLTQNPENYFDEIEQVAFHAENLVPGIELSNDYPVKAFTDSDIQMSRLCSANFTELPLNRSRMVIDKFKRDIQLRTFRNIDNASCDVYSVEGPLANEKRLATTSLFNDHFTQATLFWHSQSVWEQNHVVAAFCFELAKVSSPEIRERMVANLMQVDNTLAARVAEGLGITLPVSASLSVANIQFIESSLSMVHTRKHVIVGRCVAVLVGNGFEGARLMAVREELVASGATVKMIGSRLGEVKCSQGRPLQIDKSLATVGSVMFDAVYIPGGHRSVEALCRDANAVLFVKEAYKHGKAVAASNEGGMLITRAARSSVMSDVFKGPGVITAGPNTPTDDFVKAFIDAVSTHRFSERPDMGAIVA
ncbi:MAG TPA: catalase, partial [Cellvibrio sp.]